MKTAKREPKTGNKVTAWLKGFLDSKNAGVLIGKCVLLLALTYAYLMLCGLVFDRWLKWYFMTGFIFYSLIVLFVAALCLDVYMIIRFIKKRKGA